MIKFDKVTKAYPDGTIAVDALDLECPTGKITALVGPSGCGKTTSLRMINRLIEPTSGTISLDGESTAGMDPASASTHRVRDPARGSLSPSHHRRQHSDHASIARCE